MAWGFARTPSDLTMATEGTLLGAPQIQGVSSPPTMIIAWLTGIKKTNELLLTGDMIDAEEAARTGLINKAVPQDGVMHEAEALAPSTRMLPYLPSLDAGRGPACHVLADGLHLSFSTQQDQAETCAIDSE